MSDEKSKKPISSKLEQKHVDRVNAWTKDKLGGDTRPCTMCGNENWTLLPDFISLVPWFFTKETILLSNSSYANFAIVCTNCGNTQLFNALSTGVIVIGEDDG